MRKKRLQLKRRLSARLIAPAVVILMALALFAPASMALSPEPMALSLAAPESDPGGRYEAAADVLTDGSGDDEDGEGEAAEQTGGGRGGRIELPGGEVPLAGWILMWLDEYEDGAVCYDRGEITVFVPFSFVYEDRIYFFGYPYNDYYLRVNPKEFNDVEGHWAEDNIIFIAEREASVGYPDGSFQPNAQMTRAMFATILARMITADLSDYNYRMFDDVDPDIWYGPSVSWAFEHGIVEGIGGGFFAPNGSITRQDMILMIERFLDVFSISLTETEEDEPFYDEETVSFWAADAVALMRKHSIVTGRPGNQFDPRGFSTRAEVATVLFRLVESAIAEAHSRME